MKSQVKLYYSTASKPFELESHKLFVLEDFTSYLAQFTPLTLNDFQYIKDESMEIQIKIIANESNIDLLKAYRWKYCSILNEDATSPRYYFVKNIEWVSQGACVLSLLLDVLNTFQVGTDYSFNAKTNILREHRDRWKKYDIVSSQFFQFSDFDSEFNNDTIYGMTKSWSTKTLTYNGYFYIFKISTNGGYKLTKSPVEFDELRFYNTYSVSTGRNISVYVYKSGTVVATFLAMQRSKEVNSDLTPAFSFSDIVVADMDAGDKTFLSSNVSYIFSVSYKNGRIIDKVNEDINPVLFKDDSKTIIIEDDNSVGNKWNLVYRNQNDPGPDSLVNPVDCYLVPEDNLSIKYGTSLTGRINPSDLDDNIYYYINQYNFPYPIGDFTLDDNSSIDNSSPTNYDCKGFVFYKKNGTTIGVRRTNYSGLAISDSIFNTEIETAYIDFPHTSFPYGRNPDSILTLLKEFPYRWYSAIPMDWYTGFTWNWASITSTTINSINLWDKTDAKLIKIIKLPYIPDDIPVVSGYLEPSGRYNVVSVGGLQALKLLDLNYKFLNHLDTAQVSPIEEVYQYNNADRESKLYSSEFFIKKYVYDSFALPITMENIDYSQYSAENPNGYLNINFYTTSTINSRFAFEIADYVCTRGDSDYYKWLTIARNNEAVLYNIAYINFIRSGYNYEVKNKNISSAMSWAQVGVSAVGTIGAILGAMYGNPMAIPMAVGLATTTAMSIANAINTTNKNERDMEQKLKQLKEQSANVSGSDDVDLMTRYNGNNLLLVEYHASEAMQELLNRLFYYTGYKTNRYGLPLGKTRENFDYLQCNPVFDYFNRNLTSEIESQLELCYRTGVTFIYKHNVIGWDMDQTSPNLEINFNPLG